MGGASPAGSPAPIGVLEAIVEAFECLEFGLVQQLGSAGPGSAGEVVEGDETGTCQDDDQFRQILGPVALREVIQGMAGQHAFDRSIHWGLRIPRRQRA